MWWVNSTESDRESSTQGASTQEERTSSLSRIMVHVSEESSPSHRLSGERNAASVKGPKNVELLGKYEEVDAAENVLKHAGDFGRFQKLLFLGMCPFGSFFALVYFVQFFITLTPNDYWCAVPQLSSLSADKRRDLAIPKINNKYSQCHMYDVDWSTQPQQKLPSGTPLVECKYGWEFDHSEIPYPTVSSERGWVCDKESFPMIAQSVFFGGSIAGGIISGWMADKYGRIPALIASNMVGCIGGVATTFTKDMWDFTLCRFIVGMAFDNCFMMMFILALEYVGIQHRTLVANMAVALYFGGTLVVLPWVAKSIGNWKTLIYVTSLPMLIVLLAPWTIPESARWLISRGKLKKAVNIIQLVEKINGTKVPEDVMEAFINSTDESTASENLLDMFRDGPVRAMLLMLLVVYGAESVVYDGMVRITENLGMDIFLTFSLCSLSELPSNIIIALLLDRIGRKQFAIIPMMIAGVLSLIAGFIPKGLPVVILSMIARFLIIVAYNTVTQWAFEILPTTVRASGSSLTHMCGYFATIFAPAVVYSDRVWGPLPFLLLGFLALCGAGICMLLPETKGKHMPQTIIDSKLMFYSTCFGQYYRKRHRTVAVSNN